MAVKWVDNSVANLASNFVGAEPIWELERWCGEQKIRKNIPCLQIVQQYSKSMEGVDLTDVLLFVLNTVQDKALIPKDILASHRYGKDRGLDPIKSSLSSKWKTK